MVLWRYRAVLAATALVYFATPAPSRAADVFLSGADALGTSSFNAAGQWSNGQPPSPANDYFTGDFRLRTPSNGGSYTFGGASLTVDNNVNAPGGDLFGLSYKGTGGSGVITIDNLILDGGSVNHINGGDDVFNLDGSINVVSDSQIHAKQGPINVLADISGASAITNPGSDGGGRTLTFFSSESTFTGDLINDGRFRLAEGAVLNFDIGPNGVNNAVTGSGPQTAYDGVFNFDLTNAGDTLGDSWTVAAAANQTYGESFSVSGFQNLGDVWVNNSYVFDTTTGVLSVSDAPDRLTLRVVSDGSMFISNSTEGAPFSINYYEIRSPEAALTATEWAGIDGDLAAGATTWEQAGGSSANLLAETNLLGALDVNPGTAASLGGGYAGPNANGIEFYYGLWGGQTLVRGYVEFVPAAARPGDFNDDGQVDALDYAVWREAMGGVADEQTALAANGDGSGFVDLGDFNVWLANYGDSVGVSAPAPEPGGLLLLMVCLSMGAPRGLRNAC